MLYTIGFGHIMLERINCKVFTTSPEKTNRLLIWLYDSVALAGIKLMVVQWCTLTVYPKEPPFSSGANDAMTVPPFEI